MAKAQRQDGAVFADARWASKGRAHSGIEAQKPRAPIIAALTAATILLTTTATTSAQASVERFALIIGHDTGTRNEPALRYAEQDATKLHEVLSDLGGFRPENTVLLRGHDAPTVRRALIALNDRIRTRITEGAVDPLLLVYFSGHADPESLHLGTTNLELNELEQLVRGSAARFRLMIIDACRSGALTRVKGGTRVPPFPIDIEERLPEEGLIYLTSTSANEDAQESDELKGSFFTHYLISAMTGAADENNDGVVMLDEAYAYAYAQTIRASSRTILGVQHPTFEYRVHGRGGIVLTRLDQTSPRSAKLSSRTGRAYLIMQQSSEGPVVAEISPGDRDRLLHVRPGKYFVRSRASDALLEGEVSAEPGSVIDLDALPLQRTEYARLVRKGGGDQLAVHGVVAGYQLRTAIRAEDNSVCQGGFAGYTLDFEVLSISPRLGLCRSSFRANNVTTTADTIDLQLRLRHAWDLRWFTVETGLGAGAALLHQSFRQNGAVNTPPDRTTAAAELSAGWAIGTDLPAGLYVAAEVTAVLYLFREEQADHSIALAKPIAGELGLSLGKRW